MMMIFTALSVHLYTHPPSPTPPPPPPIPMSLLFCWPSELFCCWLFHCKHKNYCNIFQGESTAHNHPIIPVSWPSCLVHLHFFNWHLRLSLFLGPSIAQLNSNLSDCAHHDWSIRGDSVQLISLIPLFSPQTTAHPMHLEHIPSTHEERLTCRCRCCTGRRRCRWIVVLVAPVRGQLAADSDLAQTLTARPAPTGPQSRMVSNRFRILLANCKMDTTRRRFNWFN